MQDSKLLNCAIQWWKYRYHSDAAAGVDGEPHRTGAISEQSHEYRLDFQGFWTPKKKKQIKLIFQHHPCIVTEIHRHSL